jgi:hypothetical protein
MRTHLVFEPHVEHMVQVHVPEQRRQDGRGEPDAASPVSAATETAARELGWLGLAEAARSSIATSAGCESPSRCRLLPRRAHGAARRDRSASAGRAHEWTLATDRGDVWYAGASQRAQG